MRAERKASVTGEPETAREGIPTKSLAAWSVRFIFRARSYTLFKRANSATAPFYFHFQAAGHRHKLCLRTADPAEAMRRAEALLEVHRLPRTRQERAVVARQAAKGRREQRLASVPIPDVL